MNSEDFGKNISSYYNKSKRLNRAQKDQNWLIKLVIYNTCVCVWRKRIVLRAHLALY